MTTPHETELHNEAIKSLERMQAFDVNTLVRQHDLGTSLSFSDVVEPAQRLIDLYKRLTAVALQDFAQNYLQQIKEQANSDYNLFDQILKFQPAQTNPEEARKGLITNVVGAYQRTFQTLHPLIAYSLHRSADFQRLDTEARATFQDIQDQAKQLKTSLEKQLNDALQIVEDIRKAAAETGVSQQAIFFKEEAENHQKEADLWQKRTVKLAWLLGLYAVASLFIAKIPWIVPTDTYQSIQLGVSKVLIFAVISYMLYLSARNFLSHKHNQIVNKHRQNALMTYKALVDAAGDGDAHKVVLQNAATCIFSPQQTGYTGVTSHDMPKATSIVEVLSKPLLTGHS